MVRLLERIDINKVSKILTFAVYPAGILGMVVLAFDVGPFHIFPYRILIPIIWLLVIIRVITNPGRLFLLPLKVKIFAVFLVVWLVYAAISINWAIDTILAARHVGFLLLAFSVIAFSVVFFDTVDDMYLVSILWLVVLGLMLLLGSSETIFGYHLPGSRFYQTQKAYYLYTPTAVFYNPNDFATYLSLSAPFLLSFFLFSKRIFYRFLFLFSFFDLMYLIVATGSRGNMLATLLVVLFFIILAYISQKYRQEIYLLIGGSLTLVVIFRNRIITDFGNLINAFQTLSAQLANPTKSIGIRVNLIRNGFYFLKSTWGFGVGAGNFESWMQSRAVFSTGHITSAHNWFLEILVNYGVFIFIGYLILYFGMSYQIYRVIRTHWDDQKMRVIGVAILGALVGFSLASMSSSSVMAFRPQWLIFALGLSYINIGYNLTNQES